MDIQVVVLIAIVVAVMTATATWQVAQHKAKMQCLGDIFVDWTDPQNVEFYMALDKAPDESIKDHDIIYMRVHDVSGAQVL